MIKVLTIPDPKLKRKAKKVAKVDKKILRIIKEMFQVLKQSDEPKGIGLAAVQLGILKKIILVQINQNVVPLINPEIDLEGEITEGLEGCLSVPNIYGYVNRPSIVHLQALSNFKLNKSKLVKSADFKPLAISVSGLAARIIQHEVDHLNGILFVDRIVKQKGKFYRIAGKDKDGKEIFKEIKLDL